MSGNRTLHREQIGLSSDGGDNDNTTAEPLALWSLACTPSDNKNDNNAFRVWAAGSQGGHTVRGYTVEETSLQEKQDQLEASALRLRWTCTCTDTTNNNDDSIVKASLGCSRLSTVRNYTGQDDNAGDLLLLSLDLSNVIRLWNLGSNTDKNTQIQPVARFGVKHATGTTAALLPPRCAARTTVVTVAVGCLDGTVALVSTGVPLFDPHNHNKSVDRSKLPPAGTVLETLGSPGGGGANVPLSLAWNPVVPQTLAVGHGTGSVHLYTPTKHYRLPHLGDRPVRAVTFTTDGHLLVGGNDQGRLCVWDCSSPQQPPALVHHLSNAHNSWILSAVAVDAQRLATVAADQTVSVWTVGQLHQASHTFQSNQALWSLATITTHKNPPRLVAGSDNGWLEVFSLEARS